MPRELGKQKKTNEKSKQAEETKNTKQQNK